MGVILMSDTKTRIKQLRQGLNLTMKEVAEAVGVTEATISRWESGHIGSMRSERLEALAKILQTTPQYILCLIDDPIDYNLLYDPHSVQSIKEKLLPMGREYWKDKKAVFDENAVDINRNAEPTYGESSMAKRLKALRIQRNMEIDELAKASKVSVKRIKAIEGGSIDFSMKEIQKICDGLGVDVDMLMNWDQKQVNRLNAQAELLASLSEKEIRVALAYREHTELQAAIDKLLEIKE